MARPRTRDATDPRQYVGGPIPVTLKRQLELAAAFNGRSLNAEWQARIEGSFRPDEGYPPELSAFLELLGRTMRDAGETIAKANHLAGHPQKPWIDDGYCWQQAINAGQHILELSRPENGEPHGVFASSDYPKEAAHKLGELVANGILEVARGLHPTEPGVTVIAAEWAAKVRERLGTIGARLDRHPSPEHYAVRTTEREIPARREASKRRRVPARRREGQQG